MDGKKTINFIGIVEIFIGGLTLTAVIFSILAHANTKTPNVLIFVVVTSLISLLLGIGILKHNKTAYQLLIYFSSVIVLSKILIFTNIIGLNGAMETSIPQGLKNNLSILYHFFVIVFLCRKNIKTYFYKI